MTAGNTELDADALKRGTRRLLARHGFATAVEVPLPNGQRADIVGLGSDGMIWIVEVKASRPDFQADAKWPAYADYCDSLAFAVAPDFPRELLPGETGVIVADEFDAALLVAPPARRLTGARRRSLTWRLARFAFERLHRLDDPWLGSSALRSD